MKLGAFNCCVSGTSNFCNGWSVYLFEALHPLPQPLSHNVVDARICFTSFFSRTRYAWALSVAELVLLLSHWVVGGNVAALI